MSVITSPSLRVILSVAKNLIDLRTGSAKQSYILQMLRLPRTLTCPRNDILEWLLLWQPKANSARNIDI